MNVSKLTKVILVNIIVIALYIIFVVVGIDNYRYLQDMWYEMLYMMVGFISVTNATLIKSKILTIAGLLLIVLGFINIL